MDNGADGAAAPAVYPKRPDIGVRNIMKSELGRWPNKQELKDRLTAMGIPEASLRGRKVKRKTATTTRKAGLITLRAAAALLENIHVSSLYNWVRKKKLKGYRVKDSSQSGFHYEVDKIAVLALKKSLPDKNKPTSPAAKASREYRRKKKEAAPQVKAIQVKAVEPVATNGFDNHVSFAYGCCLNLLTSMAASIGMPLHELTGQVGDLLRKGGK